jgi:hypothetical protein
MYVFLCFIIENMSNKQIKNIQIKKLITNVIRDDDYLEAFLSNLIHYYGKYIYIYIYIYMKILKKKHLLFKQLLVLGNELGRDSLQKHR